LIFVFKNKKRVDATVMPFTIHSLSKATLVTHDGELKMLGCTAEIDMNVVLKTAENVGGGLGVKLDKVYVSELPKFSWISMYPTSLEV